MSIFVGKETRLLVQGITGREGSYHTSRCIEYGTNVVAGVTPGKGGQLFADKVPVYDTVKHAVLDTKANTSLIFVPPAFAGEAIIEAVDSGIETVICITEGLPVSDSIKVCDYVKRSGAKLIGPNCPGIISPVDNVKAGIMPGHVYAPGRVGVVSRSGTLTYEAVGQLTPLGIGQSTCVGIGGDPVSGSDFVDVLNLFEKDDFTDAIVMIGEIGGTKEQEAAEFIKSEVSKPVISLIVGQTAPPGRRMGHAGAIITGTAALASSKVKSLEQAGAFIVPSPADIGSTTKQALEKN
ncbi:MAG: succinate--CoA ligase subunit alpha [Dehalococcoidia bacterium]|nr:succinate--CoA ligase subunit alpha [Dehalococcoidia bacterium]MQG15425.1 succinate--CoA ligase subunit alpha [SAR202 cluster bacterium]|tara:strand:- start:5966 stop:6847 length:882 start_codon:yes stop_codon:yes gene_type:complete